MKVNVFRMLINLTTICAISQFAFLSAAEIPQSDVQKSEDVATTLANLQAASNEAVSNETTKAPETSKAADNENASVEGGSSTDTMPPLVFPADEEKTSTKNETLLKILQSSSNAASTEDQKANEALSEATTLTSSQSDNVKTLANSSEAVSGNSTVKETPEDDYDSLSEENDKNDAENIQDINEQEEGALEEEFGRNGSEKASINVFQDPVTNEPALHSGHFALIFASTLIIFSVVAYVGLILWRSRLESRYGMRQQLVTEDDYYNNNDVRYFGL